MFYITLNIEGVDEEEEEEEEEEEGGERREMVHVGSVERVESGSNLRPWRKGEKLFPSQSCAVDEKGRETKISMNVLWVAEG